MNDVVSEINVIIDSPLMYIVVGVVLTLFSEWRVRKFVKKVIINPIVREIIKDEVKKRLKDDEEEGGGGKEGV